MPVARFLPVCLMLLLAACTPNQSYSGSGSSLEPSVFEVMRWEGFSGTGDYTYNGWSLLPEGNFGLPQTDTARDMFVQLASDVRDSTDLPVDLRVYPSLDPVIERAALAGIDSVGRLVGKWPDGRRAVILVVDDSPQGEKWLRRQAEQLDCVLGDPWYPFGPEELPGSFAVQSCPSGQDVLVLNVSQFARPSADGDPSRVVVTIGDDLFGLWQERFDPDVLSKEPRWLTQGSQQLPFLLYVAARSPERFFTPQLSPSCEPDLTKYDFEDIAFNTEVSCPHEVGRAAVVLLASQVGLDKIAEYFTQPASSSAEEFALRFEYLAGQTYEAFNLSLGEWLDLTR